MDTLPDNLCPQWCLHYGKRTPESKQACKECCGLDVDKDGQDG